MLAPQWVLERLERGRLVLRLRVRKSRRFDIYPTHIEGCLMSYTGGGRETQGFGFVEFEISDTRLHHFKLVARATRPAAEPLVCAEVARWKQPWDLEEEQVVAIDKIDMRHSYDTVPPISPMLFPYMTLMQGLFYMAARKSHTGPERAMLKDMPYKLERVLSEANEQLYGWY